MFDIVEMIEIGRQLARERKEVRIQFTDQLTQAAGADLLLVSGSLHYFTFDFLDFIDRLSEKPKHILINRTPITNGVPVVNVQDATSFLVACRQIARPYLVKGLERLDYELVDAWSVPELHQYIPFYPEHSLPEYSGMYFRIRVIADSP